MIQKTPVWHVTAGLIQVNTKLRISAIRVHICKVCKEKNMTKVKQYCGLCGFETAREQGEDCPYHQKTLYDSDGAPYRKYEEFNDDGEEW